MRLSYTDPSIWNNTILSCLWKNEAALTNKRKGVKLQHIETWNTQKIVWLLPIISRQVSKLKLDQLAFMSACCSSRAVMWPDRSVSTAWNQATVWGSTGGGWWENRLGSLYTWRHQMETYSASLAICEWNSSVTDEFPSQGPVTRSFDIFSLICAWTNGWANNRYAGDLRRHGAHCNVMGSGFYIYLHQIAWDPPFQFPRCCGALTS